MTPKLTKICGCGGMADAHGSGPCARKGVKVQVLSAALYAEGNTGYTCVAFFHALEAGSGQSPLNPSLQRATPVTRVLPFSCSRSRFRSKPPQPLFAEGNTGYTCVAFFHALEAGSGQSPLNPSLQRATPVTRALPFFMLSKPVQVTAPSTPLCRGGCCKTPYRAATAKAPSGNTLSDVGDSAVRVPRIRKVFPEVGATTEGTSSSARILSKPVFAHKKVRTAHSGNR